MNKVLVLESSKTFGMMLVEKIQADHGFECVSAYTLAEAKEILEQDGDSFFCATIDVHLPDAQKGESVSYITQFEHISPIVITGETSLSLREDMLHSNIADYVLKDGQHNLDYVVNLINRLYNNSRYKVLVVDDSATARLQVINFLTLQRFQVYQAPSGAEALDVLKQHPDIRLVLLDCHMDGMDGMELTNIIRSSYAKDEMSIIGISSQGNISAEFIKNGANDFLLKPFQPEEFNCRINQNIELLEIINEHKKANHHKTQLLGMTVHDIIGPMSAILGAVNIIQRHDADQKKKDKFLNIIFDTSKKIIHLLDDLLDFSAIESGKVTINPVPQQLHKLLDQRVLFYQSSALKKGISLEQELVELPPISYDSFRIEQVIDNILSNAIKYSPLNSIVKVKLSIVDDMQRVDVIDQGPGIPEAMLTELFCAFHTLGSPTTGGESSNGLGLAICKNMVEAHNGKIGYEKNPQGGSCFYFMLPQESVDL